MTPVTPPLNNIRIQESTLTPMIAIVFFFHEFLSSLSIYFKSCLKNTIQNRMPFCLIAFLNASFSRQLLFPTDSYPRCHSGTVHPHMRGAYVGMVVTISSMDGSSSHALGVYDLIRIQTQFVTPLEALKKLSAFNDDRLRQIYRSMKLIPVPVLRNLRIRTMVLSVICDFPSLLSL